MNKRIFVSLLVIMMALAAMGGATVAWFTDTASTPTNEFVAGTVILDADDSWGIDPIPWENWNPGDCTEKEITVHYTGTKRAYLRVKITEEWANTLGADVVTQERDIANVSWKNADGEEWDFDEWVIFFDGDDYWWYYLGVLGPDDEVEINVLSLVCLDGPGTGNEYQGATYSLSMYFEAIQASHDASGDAWGMWYRDGAWTDEEPEE